MSVVGRNKQKQINLNEDYALTADSMNIVLLVQTKDKDGERTGNYRPLGYYSSVEACIKKIQYELVLTYLPQVSELESLSTMLENYLNCMMVFVKLLRNYVLTKVRSCVNEKYYC